MSTELEELMEYDEQACIAFIQNYIPQELKGKVDADQITYIVDLIYEFYEKEGYLDEDKDEEVEIDIEKLTAFVVKNAKKDEIGSFTAQDIEFIVEAEIEYCASIGVFEE